MITVSIGGYGTTQLEFQENETTEQMLQRLKDKEHVSFRTIATVQETMTGRFLEMDEIIVDDRYYFVTVTLEQAPRE